ncbi:hypothetical protein IGI49_002696 [Enterococcus sp. AZ071]
MRIGENIYKRKDGRWEGRYVKGRKKNGKTKFGYVYASTLNDVRNKLYPLKAKYHNLREEQGETILSFQEWGEYWLATIKREVKESTYSNYLYKLHHYVTPVIGTKSMNELTTETGHVLLKDLEEKGLKDSTIEAIFRITIQCLDYAQKRKIIKSNSFKLLKINKQKKTKRKSLTRNEQRSLEEQALKEKNGNGIPTILALHTGLRIGEISALKWEDIDFESNVIHVRHTYQRILSNQEERKTTLVYTNSKTENSARVVPMTKKLKTILKNHKKEASGPYVFSCKSLPKEPRLLTYHFHKITKKVQLSHVHFHQLRHTFATRCIEMKGDISSISALLGHSSTQLTLDTYVDALLEQRVKVISQMEKAIR